MDLEKRLTEFRSFLAERGLKLTSQREAITQVILSAEGEHLPLNDILDRAKVLKKGIGYATVYRTMRLLVDGGFAMEHHFGEAQTRYEPAIDGVHHDHLICVTCGKIVEFEDQVIEDRQDQLARERGFEVVSHKHEIYVKCMDVDCEGLADSTLVS